MSLSEFGDIPLGPRELAIRISGVIISVSGSSVRTYSLGSGNVFANLALSNLSGGTNLMSGAAQSAYIKAPTTNSGIVYIGFDMSGEMPVSGTGIIMEKGDRIGPISISDFAILRAMSTVSGDVINYGSFLG